MKLLYLFASVLLASAPGYPSGYRYSSTRKLVLKFVEAEQDECNDETDPFETETVDMHGLKEINGEFLITYSGVNEFRARHGIKRPLFWAKVCLSQEMTVEMVGTEKALAKAVKDIRLSRDLFLRKTKRLKTIEPLFASETSTSGSPGNRMDVEIEDPIKHPMLESWNSCGFTFRGIALPGFYRIERSKKGMPSMTFYASLGQGSNLDEIDQTLCTWRES